MNQLQIDHFLLMKLKSMLFKILDIFTIFSKSNTHDLKHTKLV